MMAQLLRGQSVLPPEISLPATSEGTIQLMATAVRILSGLSVALLVIAIPIALFLFLLKDARWRIIFPAGIGFFLLARILPFLFTAQMKHVLN